MKEKFKPQIGDLCYLELYNEDKRYLVLVVGQDDNVDYLNPGPGHPTVQFIFVEDFKNIFRQGAKSWEFIEYLKPLED